ncbi:SMP-30/gluconolactonase/LRE family protein [Chitinophaga polysaccharea]|uniref:SMP-30/gluconolactonase/LRE family protein n=1 Tax=Chitinophaga TaxID=79328 RepID=UPI0014558447|nr:MULTISPECIES: SMP-30/gluconolactonase/LRE family protein [Chitinophaga]NLR59964.1 SMP-30/gluconolactonase/LRE family protein [Chitinophaga polysaccharea]NLU94193.1 SMP-30/gluconolactonase/LRE family protein [Chitinophaga sp. Ak27]
MKIQICLLAMLTAWGLPVLAQQKTSNLPVFEAHDLTAENMFSVNIEGPNFDKSGNFYVVNFKQDGTVGKINTKTGTGEIFVTLPDSSVANGIHFNSKGTMFLPDFIRHNVLTVDMKTKKTAVFVHSDKFNQPNDLCINSKDQIFVTDPKWADNTGQLWRIDPKNRQLVLLEGNMGTTNGIELSPDEKTLYVNESVQRKIWKYRVDKAGNISHKTLFASFADYGFDGMKCDKVGNLYIARWGKGVIAVLSPKGKLIQEIPLKGKQCSNLVFGDKDGKTVYVTLQDRKCVEIFRVNIPGRKFE